MADIDRRSLYIPRCMGSEADRFIIPSFHGGIIPRGSEGTKNLLESILGALDEPWTSHGEREDKKIRKS
jgi:hypothetical protein